ncbi:MinD-like ATPase involved in chromosome partitioning or flagellar assembly [Glaciihabitans tibetensis]|uniref:MinD-like ATPase involved in chromosome partitioning or flagellar assembly n=1 Tax=Glaciihabitans tibetensis TaxID=1266600 RepID=A0A2T0VFH8_9MICO|nr:ParA family protein [Glaciihabitans tibetensis]PRY68953.1 MinD-like ATPase involved in chromosome partitioning or flagellar assembly [Glaciihabitans tibetensis]
MRIALALPLAVEDRLAADAVLHGHDVVARCSTAQELASRIDTVTPDVVIAAATERHLTAQLLAVCDEAGVRMLALVGGEVERRLAASVGLYEMAPSDATWPQIEAALGSLRRSFVQDAAAQPPGSRDGIVIAVWGPAGSPGRTTLAINIAAEIAAAGYSVALGDVDTHSASVAPALGMLDEAPGFAAACRLAGAESLTQAELERIGQRYRSGHSSFWVLTGIGRASRWPELSDSRVAATIAQCRKWVDFTVLDTGFSLEMDEEISSDVFSPRRNAASIAALREADRVVAVGDADPVGLSRFLRAHVDLVETVAAGRVVVVMNKIRASVIGMNPAAQVAQTLYRFGGIDAAAMIPYDRAGLDAAILTGQTLADAAARSPVRAAIRALVTSRLLPPSAIEQKIRTRSWRSRREEKARRAVRRHR